MAQLGTLHVAAIDSLRARARTRAALLDVPGVIVGVGTSMTPDSPPASVRRIITGHDPDGRAVVVADELLEARDLSGEGIGLAELWATFEMPVDASDATLTRQREGSVPTTVANGSGCAFHIGVIAPGGASPMHRTDSLDYGICLSGELEMELDSGEVTTIRAGEVVIQRGTYHRWHNSGDKPCTFAWIILDALPQGAAKR